MCCRRNPLPVFDAQTYDDAHKDKNDDTAGYSKSNSKPSNLKIKHIKQHNYKGSMSLSNYIFLGLLLPNLFAYVYVRRILSQPIISIVSVSVQITVFTSVKLSKTSKFICIIDASNELRPQFVVTMQVHVNLYVPMWTLRVYM